MIFMEDTNLYHWEGDIEEQFISMISCFYIGQVKFGERR